jgi:hypothetical protein
VFLPLKYALSAPSLHPPRLIKIDLAIRRKGRF